MDNKAFFNTWLKEHRRALDLTQKDLAERIGCSIITIKKWESGALRPSKELAGLLAGLFDIPVDQRAAFMRFARNKEDNSRATQSAGAVQAAPWQVLCNYPNNLPAPPNAFVGRADDVVAICAALQKPGARILTISGPPGIGKTRLLLEVAVKMLPYFKDGVWFMEMAPINDPRLVVSGIARVLGVQEAGGRSLPDSLKSHLRSKQMLLAVDNFEQLLAGAPLLAELAAAAPQVKVLVTSREILQIYGEHDFSLLPLAFPKRDQRRSAEDLMQYDAVRLFVDRAASVSSGFKITEATAPVIAEICARLDGLPLSIELAASHVKTLSPDEILSRLESRLNLLVGGPRNLPARQQTLRNAIRWSYDLIDTVEERIFRLISVFVGGFTFEAVGAISAELSGTEEPKTVAAPTEGVSVPGVLESLANKSLVQRGGPGQGTRYFMLETIREYGLERLLESGQDGVVRDRHVDYYLGLAEEGDLHLKGPQGPAWLERLEQEHGNLRAALDRAIDSSSPAGLRLAAALARFWEMHGHLTEGRAWLARALKIRQADAEVKEALARVLYFAGRLAWRQGDHDEASEFSEKALALYRQLGDAAGTATVLHLLGVMSHARGDYSRARAYEMDSLRIRRELGDKEGIASLLGALGLIAYSQGDYPQARQLYTESLELLRELGDKWSIGIRLHNLAGISHTQGDYRQAHELYAESLNIARELGDKDGVAAAHCNLGWVICSQADYTAARFHFEEALTISQEIGSKATIADTLAGMGRLALRERDFRGSAGLCEQGLAVAREAGDTLIIASVLHNLGLAYHTLGKHVEAESLLMESQRLRQQVNDRRGLAELLNDLGRFALEKGDATQAARLFGAADSLFENIGFVWDASSREEIEHNIARARSMVGEEIFTSVWAEGRDQGIVANN